MKNDKRNGRIAAFSSEVVSMLARCDAALKERGCNAQCKCGLEQPVIELATAFGRLARIVDRLAASSCVVGPANGDSVLDALKRARKGQK